MLVDLVGGAVQPGHHLGGGELAAPRRRRDRLGRVTSATTVGDLVGGPSRASPCRRRAAGPAPRAGRRRRRRCRAGPSTTSVSVAGHRHRAPRARRAAPARPGRTAAASACAQAGQGVAGAAPDLRGAQHREHQVDPGLAGGRVAEDVQPVADLHVLDLAQVAVDVQHEVVEVVRAGHRLGVQVVVQLGGLDQRPRSAPGPPAPWPGRGPARWRTRRAAARAWPGRRRSRRGPSAAPGGRRPWRAPRRLAWVPSPGSLTMNG